MRLASWVCVAIVLMLMLSPMQKAAAQEEIHFDRSKVQEFIQEQIEQADIPGLSVVIVQGNNTIYKHHFGHADEAGHPVTDKTLFELGSTSKAFTALALLRLEQEGKIELSDPVTKYIPWFEMEYEGKSASITLYQLLHHTSGIPEKSIGYLPVTSGRDALEKTVKAVMPLGLNREPGSRYEYATVNYDLLGLVIEKVSGQPFETYVQEQVLEQLGLFDTYPGRAFAPQADMATGYKRHFLQPSPYDAPDFKGNTPAGYFITNSNDMEKWLKLQLGVEQPKEFPADLIHRSHQPDRRVAPSATGSSYASGWEVYQSGGGQLSHEGSNPNFSSYIGFRNEEQLGVAVMANINSDYTFHIGESLLNMMLDKEIQPILFDTYKKVDQIATVLVSAVLILVLSLCGFFCHLLWQIFRRKRVFRVPTGKTWMQMFLTISMFGLMVYALVRLPDLLFGGLPWSFLQVWAPGTVLLAAFMLGGAGGIYTLWTLVNLLFPKPRDKSYLTLIVLGLISGFGNAFLIFVINETFVRTNNLENGLLFYFGLGIVMYVFSQRFIRVRIVTYANELVYEKRMDLTDKLLHTPYHKLESLEQGRIEATLNNDTEVISRSLNLLVTAGTSLLTLLFCFLYLGVMNLYAFLISLVIILVTVGLYWVIGRQADKVWNETRDIQNVYFRLIQDLRHGFKELRLHRGKRQEFREVMNESCDNYRGKRTEGDLKFANVFVVGELLFVIVIGVVAFVFPEIFKNIPKETIHNYVLVFLYMTGPVNELLNGIPQLVLVRISWKRIQEMIRSVADLETDEETAAMSPILEEPVRLQLKGVGYEYKNSAGDSTGFGVGPIDFEFNAGEIVFITGGNGSGKSTLAKLITGLYKPDVGEILLNGRKVTLEELNQCYSAILSDFHLFDRLYGIETKGHEAEIDQYLDLLRLRDKVGVENGYFTTTQLSTGQKKRLALLVTFLENRPIFLFDEWAADQDPDYRSFFYQELLPQMREKGKCIIAITHDDHYFHLADKRIKMDMGQIQLIQTEEARS
ncbi:hypothetical protein GCM10007416_07900 [Kroppenstedtia guangzhouensis]|uniref:Cyclic peptide transporter n=1 Tax=Kroppenstedtia guangzhouensis TaxID=1274356 RepID=A0ABQ1G5Y9_9BACL|nr:cyclic peptide export ABC transporter [Kroppenstedtia guangzhouensis]GGA37414.1 hypothetical protein GCM10007416_07900 [Kroppenstedtia guangzhouensis]